MSEANTLRKEQEGKICRRIGALPGLQETVLEARMTHSRLPQWLYELWSYVEPQQTPAVWAPLPSDTAREASKERANKTGDKPWCSRKAVSAQMLPHCCKSDILIVLKDPVISATCRLQESLRLNCWGRHCPPLHLTTDPSEKQKDLPR